MQYVPVGEAISLGHTRNADVACSNQELVDCLMASEYILFCFATSVPRGTVKQIAGVLSHFETMKFWTNVI